MLTDHQRATIAQLIKAADDETILNSEAARVIAKNRFAQYDAYKKAGFSEDQAFQLVLKGAVN